MADVLPTLQTKASLPDEALPRIRFLEVHSGKIHKLIQHSAPVSNLNDYCTIYADLTPVDEYVLSEDTPDRLVCCYHFEKEPSKTHNIPFVFLVKHGEIFRETKERLSKRSGIKGKAFEKIKFAVIRKGNSYGRPVYLDDEDILSEKIDNDDDLALDHPNKMRNAWAAHERLNIR